MQYTGQSRENLVKLSGSPGRNSWMEGLDDESSDSTIARKHIGISSQFVNQQQKVEGIAILPPEGGLEYGMKGNFFVVLLWQHVL